MSHLEPSKGPPGRPIVSDCNSDTYAISEYIDHFLAPIAKSHDSYLKDTQDFSEKLNKTSPSEKSLLVTLDAESLYTNTDNKDGMEAVKKAFENNLNEIWPDRQILTLRNMP